MFRSARAGIRRLAAPLALRDVRRMWLSDLLSVLGDHAAVLALAVLVYGRTHSAVAVALVSAAAFAPAFLIGPMLATLADRHPYRSVMIVCDLLRASVYFIILVPGLPVPALLALVFAAHCATFPFSAARGAQLPQIAADSYGAAQALSQSTLQVGALLGYAAGASLLALGGAREALAVDAASFLVSAWLVSTVKARARTAIDELTPEPSAWTRLRSGARTLRKDPLLFWPAVLVTVAILGVTAAESMAVVVVHAVSATASTHDATLLAALLILPAVLTLITTVICPTEGDPHRLIQIAGAMVIGSHCLAIAALMFLNHGASGTIAAAIAYTCLGVSNALTVPCVSVVGRRLPPTNRASVFALLEALLVGGQAAGALLAGWSATHLGVGLGIAILLAPGVLVSVAGIFYLHIDGRRTFELTRFAGYADAV